MTAADRLTALLSGSDAIPLDESLLLLAAARPDSTADVDAGLATLDHLAASCPEATVDALIRHLFGSEGFDGDRHDYHDPRNSYLDQVLQRRVGMPITLAVVLVEVGRRLGIELVGVGMPGHFLVRERSDTDGFIDPYHQGSRISASACEARFRALHGADAVFDPSYLQPVAPRSIVQRVLNNLTVSFRSRSPRDLDWLLAIRVRVPADPPDLQALAELCELRGRYDDAADLLERAVVGSPDHPAGGRVLERAARLRARLN
ncbi:MAG: transglutaminase-like domain-containing protein [Acidimicrobiales bacterium]